MPSLVNHYFNRDHQFLYIDSTIGEARKIVRDFGLRVLPIVHSPRHYKLEGIVFRRNLLEVSSTKIRYPVSLIAEQPLVVAEPSNNVWYTLREMLELDEWYAPVVESKLNPRYLGVLGLENIIELVLEKDPKALEDTPLKDFMTQDLIVISYSDPVRKAWQLMLSKKLAALPVVNEKGLLVGVIAEYDLLRYGYTRPRLESDNWISRGPAIREIMSTPPVTLRADDTLYDAGELMIERNIGRIYIVDDYGRPIGVVDREDLVRAYTRIRRIA